VKDSTHQPDTDVLVVWSSAIIYGYYNTLLGIIDTGIQLVIIMDIPIDYLLYPAVGAHGIQSEIIRRVISYARYIVVNTWEDSLLSTHIGTDILYGLYDTDLLYLYNTRKIIRGEYTLIANGTSGDSTKWLDTFMVSYLWDRHSSTVALWRVTPEGNEDEYFSSFKNLFLKAPNIIFSVHYLTMLSLVRYSKCVIVTQNTSYDGKEVVAAACYGVPAFTTYGTLAGQILFPELMYRNTPNIDIEHDHMSSILEYASSVLPTMSYKNVADKVISLLGGD